MRCMKYKRVGLGGTFDHFHAGHQSFLQQTAAQSEHLLIGITQPELQTTKVLSSQIEPFSIRAQAVLDFCKKNKISCEFFPLHDIYGPTLTDESIDAVFVTTETEKGGAAINSKRVELGLHKLPVVVTQLVPAEDGRPIASQRIRMGEVSRSGKLYSTIFEQTIQLSDRQRQFFSQLHGQIVRQPSASYNTVCSCVVGDSSFETFIANKWEYSLGCIDFRKQRVEYQPSSLVRSKITVHAANAAGEISAEFAKVFRQVASDSMTQHTQSVIKVDGEEDLAAVVAVLTLPLGSSVYYGQPHQGMVEVMITEEIKDGFWEVLTASA